MAPKIHHHFSESGVPSPLKNPFPIENSATPVAKLKHKKRKRSSIAEVENSRALREQKLDHQQPKVEHATNDSFPGSEKATSLQGPYKNLKKANPASNIGHSGEQRGQKHSTSKPLRSRTLDLEAERKKLPVWSHSEEICRKLRDNDVLLISGETGSGKSTQIPQFLIEESWCKSTSAKDGEATTSAKVGGCIAITQPRRVAATTLASRVADEMGSPLGPASKVGYSVRFENSTSRSTNKIKFLTEGMLLQEMLRDPWLRQYSAVIVDEVHERSVNVDLILGFLRNLVCGDKSGRGGVPIKVAVMSATADIAALSEFFEAGFSTESRTRSSNVPSSPHSLEGGGVLREDSQEWSGITSDDGRSLSSHVSTSHIQGRQFLVHVHYSSQPVQDWVDAALRTIFQIHYKEPLPGDILVFLTGQETIESLEDLVNEYALNLKPELPKLSVLPLFAALPQSAQQRVFEPIPPNKRIRKVILATNIAETSVTLSGVRFVIDCGKSKTKQFHSRLGFDSLLVKPISKSAAMQRTGRAGREAPGQCYRLYTEQDYNTLLDDNVPEILRCDLSQAILNMKARGVRDVLKFPFLTRPPREALEKALIQLLQLGALRENGEISEIGMKIAKLPLSAPLGRILLAAAEADCLAEAIDIVSCLSEERIFLNLTSEEAKEKAEAARRALFRREGDHLTLLATVQAYMAENADRRAWAERHFVSHRALQRVMDVRKQLLAQCKALQLHLVPQSQRASALSSERTTAILKCFLKGCLTNTAHLFPDGSYKTGKNQTVAIHPSSVLFGKRVEAIMFNEYVYTNRSYARNVSAVQMDWIGEALSVT